MEGLIDGGTVKKAFAGVAVVGVLATAFGGTSFLDETERGIDYRMGKMTTQDAAQLRQPGLNFKVPFITSIVKVPVGLQQEQFEGVTTYTRDNQVITANLAVFYKVPEGDIVNIYKNNPNWKTMLATTVNDSFKNALGGQDAQNVAQNRNEIMKKVTQETKDNVKALLGVEVTDVQMPNFDFDDAFETAVGLAANEKATLEQKRTQLEQSKIDAQKAEETQKGVAAAKRIAADAQAYETEVQQKAAAAGILAVKEAQAKGFQKVADAIGQANMGTYLATEKWNGSVPSVQGGSGTILDMRSIAPALTPKPGGQ